MNENWMYNEFQQIGVDYSKEEVAGDYDNQHSDFRDFEKEAEEIVNGLNLENAENCTVIDLACGTGALTVQLSKYFKKIIAVDVSNEMLDQARKNAEKHGITNIEFVNSGFLNFKPSKPADAIITKYAFHHLPDFWKQIALFNMNSILNPNGKLYLADVVYQFDAQNYRSSINNWINSFADNVSPEFLDEFETHIRDEYSTFDWILRGMLEKSYFKIQNIINNDDFIAEYFCEKTKKK